MDYIEYDRVMACDLAVGDIIRLNGSAQEIVGIDEADDIYTIETDFDSVEYKWDDYVVLYMVD